MSHPIARVDDLPQGQPVEASGVVDGEPDSLILLRHGGTVTAFLNVCPHAGRRLDWAPGKFLLSRDGHLVCAAHGASFELPSGTCVAGPCRGDALRRIDIDVVDGEVHQP